MRSVVQLCSSWQDFNWHSWSLVTQWLSITGLLNNSMLSVFLFSNRQTIYNAFSVYIGLIFHLVVLHSYAVQYFHCTSPQFLCHTSTLQNDTEVRWRTLPNGREWAVSRNMRWATEVRITKTICCSDDDHIVRRRTRAAVSKSDRLIVPGVSRPAIMARLLTRLLDPRSSATASPRAARRRQPGPYR